jgi:putative peptidoglycan lipid II flippase
MRPFGTVGLAVAGNVAVVVQAVYLQMHLARKREGLGFGHVAGDLFKVMLAAVFMGGAVGVGWWGWAHTVAVSPWSDALGLALVITLGVAVYAVVVWRLKIGGREDLEALLGKLRERLR